MPANATHIAVEAIPNFAMQTPINGERDQFPSNKFESMIKTPSTLAKQIERGMHRAAKDCFLYENEHCALFENDLKYICPRNDKDRKKKLAQFAAQYGFRLKFYCEGVFAIFGKRMPPVRYDAAAFWPSATCQASSMT